MNVYLAGNNPKYLPTRDGLAHQGLDDTALNTVVSRTNTSSTIRRGDTKPRPLKTT